MSDLEQSFLQSLKRHRDAFATVEAYHGQAMQLLAAVQDCLKQGGKVVWMGNGGSAADSQHLAAEFMVRYKAERGPLASIALTTDTSILTAHANDYHFDSVFERQVLGLVRPQDVVIGLTTDVLARARETEMFAPHGQDLSALTLPVAWPDDTFIPFNWGHTAFIYDETRMAVAPATFDDMRRLPEGVKKVQVRARGMDRIISPVGHTWDAFFMNGPQASDDFMAERATQEQAEREAF